jgi:hypothetical protein
MLLGFMMSSPSTQPWFLAPLPGNFHRGASVNAADGAAMALAAAEKHLPARRHRVCSRHRLLDGDSGSRLRTRISR